MGDVHIITVTLGGLLTVALATANPWLIAFIIFAAFVTAVILLTDKQKKK